MLRKKRTFSQLGKLCANPDKAQTPSDQRKKAIDEKAAVRVNVALPHKGPVVLVEEKCGYQFRHQRDATTL